MTAPLRYPPARQLDLVEDCHGTRVADPYRWLEDATSPETVAWVEPQNALTRSFPLSRRSSGLGARRSAANPASPEPAGPSADC